MLLNERTVDRLVESLEVRYLANRQENFYFALLTDFADAESENMPQDTQLLEQARLGIQALNEKYCRWRTRRILPFSSSPPVE